MKGGYNMTYVAIAKPLSLESASLEYYGIDDALIAAARAVSAALNTATNFINTNPYIQALGTVGSIVGLGYVIYDWLAK
jgi:hypothetical protein